MFIALALILGGGAAYRLCLLTEPVGNDEVYCMLHYAVQPVSILVRDLSLANNHVFHTLLMHWSARAFGVSELGMRLPAFLAGLAVLPLSYVVASEFDSKNGLAV